MSTPNPPQAPSDDLIARLRCPTSGRALRRAEAAELDALNAALEGDAPPRNADDEALDAPLSAGLVSVDGALLYPVVQGLAHLLTGRAYALPSGAQDAADADEGAETPEASDAPEQATEDASEADSDDT